jgi:membrane fusion protein (multidrug efflux system)
MSDQVTPLPQELLEKIPIPTNGTGKSPAHVAPPAPGRRWYRRPLPLVLLLLGALALATGAWWYRGSLHYESTDDAFIQADVVAIGPKVASTVAAVRVVDNQSVRAGQLLVELDPRDFEAKLAQARANLEAAEAQQRAATINVRVIGTTADAGVQQAEAGVQTAARQVDGARSRLEQARAHVAAAEAEATRAAADAQRYEALLQDGGVSRQQRDNAVAASRTAAADLEAARQAQQAASDGLRQATAQLGEAQARLASAKAAPQQVAYSRAQAEQAAGQVAQLQAAVRQAELELSYTKLYAPVAGRITRKSVEPGGYVQVGQALLSIVPQHVWVIANFKETQLARMRPGQPVQITVDAYPDRTFTGHVDSIQAGSGAAFSLLPPENATGNYVKVVQRVPVKILLDDPPDPAHVLGPGMSVVPRVRVQ